MTKFVKEEHYYRLVFSGHTLPGIDDNEIIEELAHVLKISTEKAERLIAGKRRYIKRVFSYTKAISIRNKVLKIGVECELATVDPKNFLLKPKGKNKYHISFPDPVNFGLEHVDGEIMPVHEKSYSETMAELQEYRESQIVRGQEAVDIDKQEVTAEHKKY